MRPMKDARPPVQRMRRRFAAPRNIEPADRVLRVLIGSVLLAGVAIASSEWRWLGLVGSLPLLTGLTGYCPLYAWLSLD